MSKLDDRNIEKVPGRCGGSAVVAGTRIRVSTILACYRQGMVVEGILQEYPHLRPADVHDALAYAYDPRSPDVESIDGPPQRGGSLPRSSADLLSRGIGGVSVAEPEWPPAERVGFLTAKSRFSECLLPRSMGQSPPQRAVLRAGLDVPDGKGFTFAIDISQISPQDDAVKLNLTMQVMPAADA